MISVIVPVYNVGELIGRTLESILEQSYTDLEIIVVNDGSTDCTKAIVDQYVEKYAPIIRAIHTTNEGVTSARLRGVQNAKGEWIGFIDGDDEIEQDMYELLLNNAIKYQADISHCGFQMIFEDERKNYFYNTKRFLEQDKFNSIKALLEGEFIEPSLCNKLFNRKLFYNILHTNVMDTGIKINEDLLMNYLLFSEANKTVFEDVCKYHYLIRSGSSSRKELNKYMIYDPIRVKEFICSKATGELREVTLKAYISTCVNVYNGLMLNTLKEFQKDERVVREKIVLNKGYIRLLSKKQQLLAFMIMYIPFFYKPIYRFYAKYLLKSKYD